MVAAGDIVRATDPFRRLATDKQTTASSAITTTETSVHSVTADLISGATYAITAHIQAISSTINDVIDARIREDSTSGTQLQQRRTPGISTSRTEVMVLYAEYTASSTASKTFVGTLIRQSGGGNVTRNPSTTSPSYMFIDRIS